MRSSALAALLLSLAASLSAGAAHAANWVPLVATASNAYEIDLAMARPVGDTTTVDIRGHRASASHAPGSGILYRSFAATVAVNCVSRTAWILKQSFFAKDDGSGAPHTVIDYSAADRTVRVLLVSLIGPASDSVAARACR